MSRVLNKWKERRRRGEYCSRKKNKQIRRQVAFITNVGNTQDNHKRRLEQLNFPPTERNKKQQNTVGFFSQEFCLNRLGHFFFFFFLITRILHLSFYVIEHRNTPKMRHFLSMCVLRWRSCGNARCVCVTNKADLVHHRKKNVFFMCVTHLSFLFFFTMCITHFSR